MKISKDECIRVFLTDDQRRELENAYDLLVSSDYESKLLALGIFQNIFDEDSYFNVSLGYLFLADLISKNEFVIKTIKVTENYNVIIGDIGLSYAMLNTLIDGYYFKKKLNE